MKYRALSFTCAFVTASLSFSILTQAATISVNSVDGFGCTLVDAIKAANQDYASGTTCWNSYTGNFSAAGEDTINFPPIGPNTVIPVSDIVIHDKNYIDVTNGGAGLPKITSNITINGNGNSVSPSLGKQFRLLYIATNGSLTINQLRLSGGRATDGVGGPATLFDKGGAIYNQGELIINQSTIRNNRATEGAGIVNTGTLTIDESYFSENSGTAIDNEGTLTILDSTINDNTANSWRGGGLMNSPGASAYIQRTTFSGNSAYAGGGLMNYGAATIKDSTFSGNSVPNMGGGIVTSGTETITLINVTLSNNTAQDGGGIYQDNGTLNIINTLVTGNHLQPASGDGAEINRFAGTVGINRNNLFGHSGISNAQAIINFPVPAESATILATSNSEKPIALEDIIRPLSTAGGPTKTHALASNSPAIDKGYRGGFPLFSEGCYVPAVLGFDGYYRDDQRGVSRPQQDACDIGAYEYEETAFFMIPASNGKMVIFGL